MSDDTRQQNQNQGAKQQQVGSVKAPGTYTRTTPVSGVIGQGGSYTGKVTSPSSSPTASSTSSSISKSITSSSTPSQTQSSNKLASVLQPPTSALTSSLPQSTYSQGYSNIPQPSQSTSSKTISYSTPSQTQSSNKLASVLQPPTSALSSSLPKSTYSQGYSNVPEKKVQTETSISPLVGTGYVKDVGASQLSIVGIKPSQSSSFGDPLFRYADPLFNLRGTSKSAFELREEARTGVSRKPEYSSVKSYLDMPPEFGYEKLYRDVSKDIVSKRQSEYNALFQSSEKKAEEQFNIAQSRINKGENYNKVVSEYNQNLGLLQSGLTYFDVPKETSRDILGQPVSKVPSFISTKKDSFGISPNLNIQSTTVTSSQISKEILPKESLLAKGYQEQGRATQGIISGGEFIKTQKENIVNQGKYFIPVVGEAILLGEGSVNVQKGILQGSPTKVVTGVVEAGLGAYGIKSGAIALESELKSLQVSERLSSLSKEPFKGIELREAGLTDTSRVIGQREFQGFTQTIKSKGEVMMTGEKTFIMPSGQLIAETKGTIKGGKEFQFGKGFVEEPTKQFIGIQGFDIGTKGISFQFGDETERFLTTGSGTLVKRFETNALINLKETSAIPKETETLFHGTTDKYTKDILEKGLQSGKKTGVSQRFDNLQLQGVFTTKEKDWATSWANMASFGKGSKVGSPNVFEIQMSKSSYEKDLIQRSVEKGGSNEFIFKEIKPENIKGYYTQEGKFIQNPRFDISEKGFTYDSKELKNQLSSNLKLFSEGKEFTKSGITSVTRRIDERFLFSNIGTTKGIVYNPTKNFEYLSDKEGFKSFSQTFEGVKINAEMKDMLLTKTTPKENIFKTYQVIDSGTGSELGLKQFKESSQLSPVVSSRTIERGLIQEFKSEIKPDVVFPKSSQSLVPKSLSLSSTATRQGTSNILSPKESFSSQGLILREKNISGGVFSPNAVISSPLQPERKSSSFGSVSIQPHHKLNLSDNLKH